MKESTYAFDLRDLERIDKQLRQIKEACKGLIAFSEEKGGIAVIDRNVERIIAPLKILLGISEVLELAQGK